MRKLVFLGTAAAVAGSAMAAPTLSISIGVRETGTAAAIGDNGGTANGIEWVNLDGQSLVLDGTWQQFTWDFANDPITAFAGATANGDLGDGGTITRGVLEHLRVRSNGFGGPMTLWIDTITNTFDPAGPVPPQTFPIGNDFEGFANGDSVTFQRASFSGSTSGNIVPGDTSGIDNTTANTGSGSLRMDWQFIDNDPSRWARITTFQGTGHLLPNPAIQIDNTSSLSIWIKGVPEPTSLLLLAIPACLLRRR